jgi:hypothetical protein
MMHSYSKVVAVPEISQHRSLPDRPPLPRANLVESPIHRCTEVCLKENEITLSVPDDRNYNVIIHAWLG